MGITYTVDCKGLFGKFRRLVPDVPECAACGRKIGGGEHVKDCPASWEIPDLDEDYLPECECGANDKPMLFWKDSPLGRLVLVLCLSCTAERIVFEMNEEG